MEQFADARRGGLVERARAVAVDAAALRDGQALVTLWSRRAPEELAWLTRLDGHAQRAYRVLVRTQSRGPMATIEVDP